MILHPDSKDKRTIKRFEKLEDDFNNIHKNFYNYDKSIYINFLKTIEIICPIHGSFFQKPGDHMHGQGCKKCSIEKLKNTYEIFIEKALKRNKDIYFYLNNIYYENKKQYIKIICKKHGYFIQETREHLRGKGCQCCAKNNKLTTKSFIEKAKEIHKNKYTYEDSIYLKSSKKILIKCKEHGNFEQTPNNHLMGRGCNICASNYGGGFNNNIKGMLYYIEISINDSKIYKIGITNNSVKKIYKKYINNIKIINTKIFEDGKKAREIEKKILNENKEYRISKLHKPIKNGNTEIFKIDIYDKIKKYFK